MEENREENRAENRAVNFLNGLRNTIESAETPFSKLAVFVLPVIAPLVPAFMTGLHMYQLLMEIFTFSGAEIWAFTLSFIVGLVLELLGYVGAIMLIKSIFTLIRKGKDGYLIPAFINLLAYLFYLILMYFVNVKLGEYFNVPQIISSIIGMLSFITVPTGLLAANHLSQKEMEEDDTAVRQEKRDDRIKVKMIKAGMNPFQEKAKVLQATAPLVKTKPRDWRNLSPDQKSRVIHVLTIRQIMDEFPVSEATAYNWKSKTF